MRLLIFMSKRRLTMKFKDSIDVERITIVKYINEHDVEKALAEARSSSVYKSAGIVAGLIICATIVAAAIVSEKGKNKEDVSV